MSPRAISLRLDPEAERALRVLTRTGRSTSEAVRASLIAAARRESDLEAEAAVLAADDADRAEAAQVAVFMDSLRSPR